MTFGVCHVWAGVFPSLVRMALGRWHFSCILSGGAFCPPAYLGAEMGLIIWAPRLNGYRIMPFKLEIERGVVSTSRLFGAEMGLRI